MALQFTKAAKQQKKARINIDGVAGAGKSLSALRIARGLSPSGRIVVLDTENSSASLYADKIEGGYDVGVLAGDMRPRSFTEALHEAEEAGYDVIIIDSLSHAWRGTLELVDRKTEASRSKNAFNEGWRAATPEHNALVDAILRSPAHVITTMRSKSEYVLEEDEKGRKIPRKIGMAPVAREGAEYEYDLCFSVESNHHATVTKTRCDLLDEKTFPLLTEKVGETLRKWLESGAAAPAPAPKMAPADASVAVVAPAAPPAKDAGAAPLAPVPPPESFEAAVAERLAVEFGRQLDEAGTVAALAGVVSVIAAAVKAGKVNAEERVLLGARHAQRKAALEAKLKAEVAAMQASAA
jgi:hypothetical protein